MKFYQSVFFSNTSIFHFQVVFINIEIKLRIFKICHLNEKKGGEFLSLVTAWPTGNKINS